MPGWYKVCQIGRSEQQVHLQQFGSCNPVSSLQYQLIGKLLGSRTHPIGELSQN